MGFFHLRIVIFVFVLSLNVSQTRAVEDDGYILRMHDTIARPGFLIQCSFQVQRLAPSAVEWPLQISTDLIIDNHVVYHHAWSIDNWTTLQKGFELSLNTPQNMNAARVSVLILLRDRQNNVVKRLEEHLPTVSALRKEFVDLIPEITQEQDRSPLVRLRAEQLALLLSGTGTAYDYQLARSFLDDVHLIVHLIVNPEDTPPTQNHPRQRIINGGYHNIIDDSWQPYRLYLPPSITDDDDQADTQIPLLICCYDYKKNADKARWPGLPQLWVSQAAANKIALLQIFPAGDGLWNGVTPYRLWNCVDQCLPQHPQLDADRVFLCGSGHGAWTAMRAALLFQQRQFQDLPPRSAQHLLGLLLFNAMFHPTSSTPLPWNSVDDLAPLAMLPCAVHGAVTQLLSDWTQARDRQQRGLLSTAGISDLGLNDSWRWIKARLVQTTVSIAHPQSKIPTATTTTPEVWNIAAQKVCIITGNGEHLAAHQHNQALRDTLVTAWVAHAHSNITSIMDIDARPTNLTHDLICIGNARGNSVLKKMLRKHNPLGITWDQRFVHFPGGKIRHSDLQALQLHWVQRNGLAITVIDGAALSSFPTASPQFSESTNTLLPLSHVQQSWIRAQDGKIVWSSSN